jgi:hypothetical protein
MTAMQRLAAALAAFRGRVHPALPKPPVPPVLPSRPVAPAIADAAAIRAGLQAQAEAATKLREDALATIARLDAARNALKP